MVATNVHHSGQPFYLATVLANEVPIESKSDSCHDRDDRSLVL